LVSTCGGWLVFGSFRERVEVAVRRPVWSALLGIALIALISPLLRLAVLSLYIFPPLAFLLFFSLPIVYWFVLAIGFAAVAEWIGLRLVRANRLGARLTGAALLIALMLVPVVGPFVMVAVMVVAVGAGTAVLPWQRPLSRHGSLSSR